MADTVEVDYVYPPNMLNGDWDEQSGNHRVTVHLMGLSDGTGETDVTKIDLTDLKTPNGNVPGGTAVESIDYIVTGITCALEWDRTPHKLILRMDGNGGSVSDERSWDKVAGKVDPCTDGGTGDILLTTTNADAGDTYDITLCLRLKD